MAAEELLDRLATNTALALPDPLARPLAVAWLAGRMHPFSFTALAQTALARRLEAWRQ
jgi:hypothetical protein